MTCIRFSRQSCCRLWERPRIAAYDGTTRGRRCSGWSWKSTVTRRAKNWCSPPEYRLAHETSVRLLALCHFGDTTLVSLFDIAFPSAHLFLPLRSARVRHRFCSVLSSPQCSVAHAMGLASEM